MRRLSKKQIAQVGVVRAAYLRIMFAAECGFGVHLTPVEVDAMASLDDAIFTAATVAAEELGINLDTREPDAEAHDDAR